jgi:TRAP-type C4-dicarboxylate transport system permease small subunit
VSTEFLTPDQPDEIERRSRFVRVLVWSERVLSTIALLGTLGFVLTQVVSRYAFSHPFSWTEEVARFSLVWLAFIGAGFVMARRAHITVDLLIDKLGPKLRAAVNAFSILAVLVSAAVMTWAGAKLALATAALKSPAADIPMPVLYCSCAVGFGLIFIHGLLNSVFDILRGGELKVGTSEIELGQEMSA